MAHGSIILAALAVLLGTAVTSCTAHGIPPGLNQVVRDARSVSRTPVSGPVPPATIVFDAGNPDSVLLGPGTLSIVLTQGATGRARTSVRYPPGTTFSARAKCPTGDTSGLVSSLYLSSLEGSKTQDEIDFEWLGTSKTSVQLNYYVYGLGGREHIHDLGFDCSLDFHTYTIYYGADSIKWFIDGVQVYEALPAPGQPWPTQNVYFYQSIWDASSINGGTWAGVQSYATSTFVVAYNSFAVYAGLPQ